MNKEGDWLNITTVRKRLNEQITKQDGIVEHKARTDTNNYVYVGGLSFSFVLAISGYLQFSKCKKPEQTLIHVPTPPVVKTNTEPKRDIFEML